MLKTSWISAGQDMEHRGLRLQARVHRGQGFRQVIYMFEDVVSEDEIKFSALQFGIIRDEEPTSRIPFPGVLNRVGAEIASECPPAIRQGQSENLSQNSVAAAKVQGLTGSGKIQSLNQFGDSPLLLSRPLLHVSAGVAPLVKLD